MICSHSWKRSSVLFSDDTTLVTTQALAFQKQTSVASHNLFPPVSEQHTSCKGEILGLYVKLCAQIVYSTNRIAIGNGTATP